MNNNQSPLGLRENLSKAKYIVSFISVLSPSSAGYDKAADQMMQAVQNQIGFVAVYSARDNNGVGITLSYWTNLDAISSWKNNNTHQAIQRKGKTQWYDWYQLQVSEIVRTNEGGQLLAAE